MPYSAMVSRLRAEYLEMPGLRLKLEQAQRLCGVERVLCQQVLDALIDAKFLCLRPDGAYARLTDGAELPRPRPAKAELGTRRKPSRRGNVFDRRDVGRGGRRQSDRTPVVDLRGPRPAVLIIDANEDGRHMMAEYLVGLGFAALQAADGQEALAKARHCQVALLEMSMPDVSGLALAADLRARPETAAVTVIIHTSRVTPETRASVSAAGISTFVPKPTELRVVTAQLLGAYRRHLAA